VRGSWPYSARHKANSVTLKPVTNDPPYAAEALERWGDTDAYRESERRTASYSRTDWAEMRAELEAIEQRLSWLMTSGVPADGAMAREAAEQHRRHISTWFYDCSPEMHRLLAQMYVTDAGFTEHYDRRAPGLAQYVHDAILATV
jgi:hypothetical protein